MKKFFKCYLKYFYIFIFIILYITFSNLVLLADNSTIYGEYSVGNINFISYSKNWNTKKLKELYLELLNNFHGDEFDCLKNIYIFPDSPHGVNGYYKEHSYLENGSYILGNEAYIELYNGDTLNTLDKIAPILAHEYGHHYTIYNIYKYEGIYLNNYENSEYYKIRNLDEYPVLLQYTNSDEYIYHWDILELLAYDYVQLLGSSRAKQSTYFKDLKQIATENLSMPDFYTNSFNSKPQINNYLPLASEVDGLYNYLLKIAGFTSSAPKLEVYPQITSVTASKTITDEIMFEVKWSEGYGSGTLEYTLVMSPVGNPFSVIPIKTVYGNEDLSAIFGSFAVQKEDGSIYSISHPYLEEVTLKIYIKDEKGFIYSSEPAMYNLTDISNDVLNEKISQNDIINTYTQNSVSYTTPNVSTSITNFNVIQKISTENRFILENSMILLLKTLKK